MPITKRVIGARRSAAAIVAAGLLAAGPAAAPQAAGLLQLKYVVILTRHGVRSPTWTNDRLNRYSAEPWPDWGVAPGNLTAHGRAAMVLFGAFYRAWMVKEGLLAGSGCRDRDRISIWADVDERTIETGHALADGLGPGCGLRVDSLKEGAADPLFDPIASGLAKPDPALAAAAVRERINGPSTLLFDAHRKAFSALDHLLTGGGQAPMRVDDGTPISLAATSKGIDLVGPLSTASTFSENLLLEYANGFRGKTLGWGRLDARTLSTVLELHAAYANLMRKTPYLARVRGSNLAAHVFRSLQQAATDAPVEAALGRRGDVVLALSGHDTNLSNIAGMLGLSWHLAGYQPDDTPPGGALVFSLWRDIGTQALVMRTTYLAQSLDQLSNLSLLTLAAPPESENLLVPGCPADSFVSGCPWEAFSRAFARAIDPAATNVR